jgi:hypothetical protein
MKNVFVVPGYGIPKNILEDQSYRKYLGLVFNYVFEVCTKTDNWSPVVVFCGGPTDIFKPYKRTEGNEMKRLFLKYTKRDFVKNYTKNWSLKTENKSLSTHENIMLAKNIISKIKGERGVYIFCEYTRRAKIKAFAKEVLTDKFLVVPFDFDLSANRYRDPKFITKKENLDKKFGLMSIRDKDFHARYRKMFVEKLAYFRKMGPAKHQEAINIWWHQKIKELENGQLAQR